MKNRRKRGIALSDESIKTVRIALVKKEWTQHGWSYHSHASVSTLKRLLTGKRIDPGLLHSALEALELSLNELTLQTQPEQPPLATSAPVLSSKYLGFFMSTSFSQNKKSKIETAISHLRELLSGCEIIYHDNEDGVVVTGDFDESKRTQIETTLKYIQLHSSGDPTFTMNEQ